MLLLLVTLPTKRNISAGTLQSAAIFSALFLQSTALYCNLLHKWDPILRVSFFCRTFALAFGKWCSQMPPCAIRCDRLAERESTHIRMADRAVGRNREKHTAKRSFEQRHPHGWARSRSQPTKAYSEADRSSNARKENKQRKRTKKKIKKEISPIVLLSNWSN